MRVHAWVRGRCAEMAATRLAGGVQHAAAAPSVECAAPCLTVAGPYGSRYSSLCPCTQFVADKNGKLVVLGEGATGICYLARVPVGDVAVKVHSKISSKAAGWVGRRGRCGLPPGAAGRCGCRLRLTAHVRPECRHSVCPTLRSVHIPTCRLAHTPPLPQPGV